MGACIAAGALPEGERRLVTGAAEQLTGEQTMGALVQHAHEIILLLDGAGGLRYANPAAEALFGLPQAELRDRDLLAFVHPGDREHAAGVALGTLAQASAPVVLRVAAADGSWRVLEALVTDCRAEPGVAGIVVNARDVTEAHQTRAALARSEALLREAQRISHIGHWEWEVDPDRLTWLSDELYAIHGLSPAQWVGTSEAYIGLVPAEDRPLLRAAIERCITTGAGEAVHRVVRPDGTVRFVRTHAEVAEATAGAAVRVVGTCQDVTEQEELRRALHERVKELTCYVQVSRAASELDDVEALCAATAAALVPALERSAHAGARVVIDDVVHERGAALDDRTCLAAPIVVGDRDRGRVCVGDGGGFLPEDAELVDAVAGTLALWLEHHESVGALAESEARFRRLFDHAADVIYRYRVDADPPFDYVSPAVERLVGYTPEECLADPDIVGRVVHPDDLDTMATVLAGHVSEGAAVVRARHRDGTVRWIEHHTVPVHDEQGGLVAVEGVARDVTDRVVAVETLEQRMREQAVIARLGEIALTADGLAAVFDAAAALVAETLPAAAVAVYEHLPEGGELLVTAGAGWPDGVVGEARVPAAGGRLGATAQDAPDVAAAAGPARAPPFAAELGYASGASATIATRSGAVGALAAYAVPERTFDREQIAFLRAVATVLGAAAEREHADEAVQRREREFRMLAEHSLDIIARFDREHRHLYVNPVIESITGRPVEVFIGRTNDELGHPPALVAAWDHALEEVFTTGKPTTREFDYEREHGVVGYVTHLVPELAPDGTVATVLSVSRDITDLRRTEQERRDVLARVVAAQETERARIGEEIHDDSVQVMAAVALRLEALQAQLQDEDTAAAVDRLAATVQRAIMRLRTLMFALRPSELDRDGLAATLRQYLETTLSDERLRWQVVDHCPRELPVELRSVLYRIAQEAIANVRKHASATELQVTLGEVDGGLRLQVRDDGRGFDVDELAVVRPHHIGARAMRERAEVAGGRLAIDSAPERGTVVTAWLPFTEAGGGA